MTIVSVDGRPVADAVRERLPKALSAPDPVASDWALRAVLAGHHDAPVRLEVSAGSARRMFEFIPGQTESPGRPLSAARLAGDLGYIRIHNSLGDGGTVAAFDSALATLGDTRGLILDLRDTPGGGNTVVARGIMSRFITSEMPYQKHELVEEERAYGVRRLWVEYVAPRGSDPYRAPVVVLVGRWTGSMGEGLAIGMDGIGRATIVGTRMAGLLGANYERLLPNSGIVVRIPAEKLYHVDGTPREEFVPEIVVQPEAGRDVALDTALRILGGGR
jgi:carboxyl-terminal processing protease